jgi:DNA-binding NarL/FixJ family response regulator
VTVVAVIADSRPAGEAIRRAIRGVPAWRTAPCLDAGRPCWAELGRLDPDLVVVDDLRSDRALLYRLREARSAAPRAKVVALAIGLDASRMRELAESGADAAISRLVDAPTLATLLRGIDGGAVFHVPAGEAASTSAAGSGLLTGRELEALRHVAAGLANEAVAARMRVTERTVAFHLSNVYRKLGVANRTEASHYAHIHGLLTGRGTDAAVAEAA